MEEQEQNADLISPAEVPSQEEMYGVAGSLVHWQVQRNLPMDERAKNEGDYEEWQRFGEEDVPIFSDKAEILKIQHYRDSYSKINKKLTFEYFYQALSASGQLKPSKDSSAAATAKKSAPAFATTHTSRKAATTLQQTNSDQVKILRSQLYIDVTQKRCEGTDL